MKNSQSIRKVLFLSDNKIALVVFNEFENSKNILFASQVALNNSDLNVRINELLTNAANFLGFNIKEVEIIFDDSNVQKITLHNEFYDCNNEEEITKAIYKKAKVDDFYVNEINFNNIIYDDIEKKAICDYEIIASNYKVYKKHIQAAIQCNLKVLSSSNIYSLINNKNTSNQVIIKMADGKTTICEYILGKLNNITNFEIQFDEVYSALSNKFDLSVDSVKQIIGLINNLEADDQTETLVSLNYDFAHKKFNGLQAKEFIESYQAEVNYLISQQINLNDFSEVGIITNDSINKLPNAKIYQIDEIIGLESFDCDKLFAFANIDINKKTNTQFEFENNMNAKIHSIVA